MAILTRRMKKILILLTAMYIIGVLMFVSDKRHRPRKKTWYVLVGCFMKCAIGCQKDKLSEKEYDEDADEEKQEVEEVPRQYQPQRFKVHQQRIKPETEEEYIKDQAKRQKGKKKKGNGKKGEKGEKGEKGDGKIRVVKNFSMENFENVLFGFKVKIKISRYRT